MRYLRRFIYIFILTLSACGTSQKAGRTTYNQPLLSEEQEREFTFNFYEGLRYKDERNFEKAYESFQKCREIDSTDTGLTAEIAEMELALGNLEAAIRGMQQTTKQTPDNWWYQTSLLGMHLQQENFTEAIKIGEHLLKKYPEKEYAYHILIMLYKQTDQLDKAIVLFDKLEKITGVNERIVFEKIGIYLQNRNYKKAQVELDKIINKFPLESRYKILKGDLLVQQGKLVDAHNIYQNILKDEPDNPYAYISLSEYHKLIDNPEESLKYIILALKSGQLDLETKLEILGQHVEHIIRAEGDVAETEDLFKLLIDYYPLEEAVHGYYAIFLLHEKRDDEALQAYESMLNINPDNKRTWLDIIQIHFSKLDYQAVVETTKRAIETTGDELIFYFYQAIAFIITEDDEQALAVLKKAVAVFDEDDKPELKSDICMHLGDVCMKLDLTAEAFEAYEDAINYNAGNIVALNNYAYYLSVENIDLAKAERMSAKTIEKEPRNSTYLDTYAWIFYMQGNYSLAKFYIERAINNLEEEQDSGVILEHYGDILWMTGEHDEKAIETWEKAYHSGYQPETLKIKIDNKGWER